MFVNPFMLRCNTSECDREGKCLVVCMLFITTIRIGKGITPSMLQHSARHPLPTSPGSPTILYYHDSSRPTRGSQYSYGFRIVPKIGERLGFIDWNNGGVLSVLNAVFGFTLTLIIFIKFIILSCSKQVDWSLLIYYDDRHKTVTTSTMLKIITIIMTTSGLLWLTQQVDIDETRRKRYNNNE